MKTNFLLIRKSTFPLFRAMAGLALLALFSGCSSVIHTDAPRTTAAFNETPIATNFQTSNQLKLQASKHWLNIADDTGRAVVDLLSQPRTCPATTQPCKTIYVKPAEVVTEFSRAFHNQLITTLVKHGLSVTKDPNTDFVVEMDVQPVQFSPNRPQYRYAGVPVQLGPGIWGLRDVASMSPTDSSITPPSANALHWFRTEFAVGQTPQAEIVVTVSIVDGTRYLSRVQNAYYIADSDRRLYDEEMCSLYKLCAKAVTAEKKGAAGVTIGVVGDCPLEACVDRDINATFRKQKSVQISP